MVKLSQNVFETYLHKLNCLPTCFTFSRLVSSNKFLLYNNTGYILDNLQCLPTCFTFSGWVSSIYFLFYIMNLTGNSILLTTVLNRINIITSTILDKNHFSCHKIFVAFLLLLLLLINRMQEILSF